MLRQVRLAPTLREASQLVTEPVASPGPGQVLIRQHIAGVNGLFDNVLARGQVPYVTQPLPFDLGVEAVGVVHEVGDGVRGVAPGDAVATSRLGGGYRAWLLTDATDAVRVPSPTARYVALRTSAVSALIALEQAGRMTSDEVVVVTAAGGGLGQFLVQFARAAGNTVVGVCGGPEKVSLLRRLGCHRPVDRHAEDVGEVLDREFGGRINLAVDTMGGPLFDTLASRLAPRGRLVSAGHAADLGPGGPAPVLAPRIYRDLYWASASVVGFQNVLYPEHHREALERILGWDAEGRLEVAIDPTRFVGLESVPAAVDHLTSSLGVGKVVVDLRDEPV
jgi:NADPH:quinone reductase-like Zn-dependent oxidoreductase